jgi:hypothetical protein
VQPPWPAGYVIVQDFIQSSIQTVIKRSDSINPKPKAVSRRISDLVGQELLPSTTKTEVHPGPVDGQGLLLEDAGDY